MSMTAQQLVAEARQQIKEVDHEGAKKLMGEQVIVLDVREPGEFEQGHLPGAVNVPRGVLEFKVGEHPVLKDPNAQFLVYCRTGGRAALACVALERMGFSNLQSLADGFEGWTSKGQPVQKSPEAC